MYEMESEKNQAIRNHKLLEERLKFQNEEKEKTEKTLHEMWK